MVENDDGFQTFTQDMKQRYYWFSDTLFSEQDLTLFENYGYSIYERQMFKPAAVGKGSKLKQSRDIRGDQIYWIDFEKDNELVKYSQYLKVIERLSRRELFLPIKRFESHFAYYEPNTFYKKHIDRHRQQPSRLLSSVLYLSHWQSGYGGELNIYDEEGKANVIEPKRGRFVVFSSSLEHEVKTTKFHRWSLTSWFRDDINYLNI